MISALISPLLVATIILVPKNGKNGDAVPSAKPQQDLIFEESAVRKTDGGIEPNVVLKKISKKKKIVKKNKKGKSITIGAPVEDSDEEINNILSNEKEWLNNEESQVQSPRRDSASVDQTLESFKKIEQKYKSASVTMDVSKQVTQVLLDKTKSSIGELYLSPKGNLRLEMTTPDHSLLIMNGKNIWVVDYPIDGMQNKVQILRGKVSKALKNQAFLGFLMGQDNILSAFSIDETTVDSDLVTYKLKPKNKDEDVQKVELQMDTDKELITIIRYWDQLGNKTQLEFSAQKHNVEIPKGKFEFSPPKDSVVTDL